MQFQNSAQYALMQRRLDDLAERVRVIENHVRSGRIKVEHETCLALVYVNNAQHFCYLPKGHAGWHAVSSAGPVPRG